MPSPSISTSPARPLRSASSGTPTMNAVTSPCRPFKVEELDRAGAGLLQRENEKLRIRAEAAESERDEALALHKQAVEGEREALTFDRFQAVNVLRCGEAFSHGLEDWSLLEWAGAAAGELGEAANICKKMRRQMQGVGGSWAARDPDVETLRRALADEIGDVLAYMSLLASAADLRLGDCAADKFDAISERVGWDGERLRALAPEER